MHCGSLLKYASKTCNSKHGLYINGLAQLMHRKEGQIKLEFWSRENREGSEKSRRFLPEKNYSPFKRCTSGTQENFIEAGPPSECGHLGPCRNGAWLIGLDGAH